MPNPKGRSRQRALLVGTAAAVLAALAFLAHGYRGIRSAEEWLSHTTRVERELYRLRELLVQESAEVRAYLLAQDAKVLRSMDGTAQDFSSSISTLRHLTRDNPTQQSRVDQMETELRAMLSLESRIVEQRAAGQGKSLDAVVLLEEWDAVRARVRGVERALIVEENHLYDIRAGMLLAATRTTLGGTLLAGVLALATLLLLVRFVQSDASDWRERSIDEARLRGLTTRMNEIELVLQLDGAVVEANDRAIEAYGYSREEIQRLNIRDLRSPATVPLVPGQIAQAASESGARFETEHVRRDGTAFPVQVSARRFQVGRESYLHSIVRDLSEERRAARELRKSDLLYNSMAQNFPNGVMALFDHDLRYVLVDGAGQAVGGVRGSLVGRTVNEIYTPEERRRFEPAFRAALRGESTDLEVEIRGGEREVHVRPVMDADGTVMMGLATSVDISARKEAERALRDSEARYASLVRNFPNGVVGLFDRDLRYVMMDGTNTIGPSDPRSWVGRTLPELCPPERLPEVEPAYRSALAGASSQVEIELQGHYLNIHVHPVREADGTIRLGVVMTQDVTEIRELQSRRAVEMRISAMGTLISGMAHEINNPLAGEMSGVGLAIQQIGDVMRQVREGTEIDREAVSRELEETLEVLGDSQSAAERIAELVRDLMTFGRTEAGREAVRLTDMAEEARRRTTGALRAGTTVRLELSSVPAVAGVAEHLERVIENLLSNAAGSIPVGRQGEIVLRVGPGSPGMVRLDVEDNGAGMSPAVMKRMFDPFFTTRGVGGGKGLGLSICQAIIHAHGGTMAAESEPGKGTRFRVELPVAKC